MMALAIPVAKWVFNEFIVGTHQTRWERRETLKGNRPMSSYEEVRIWANSPTRTQDELDALGARLGISLSGNLEQRRDTLLARAARQNPTTDVGFDVNTLTGVSAAHRTPPPETSIEWECPRCGQYSPDSKRFCTNCGGSREGSPMSRGATSEEVLREETAGMSAWDKTKTFIKRWW